VTPSDAPEGADPAKVGRWALWPMGDGRPLYHAEKLARNPDAPVIVVAGEKKADALQAVMGKAAVVVSWAGGDHGRHHVDYTPLVDRDVTMWPDADPSGIKAALGEEDWKGGIRAGACALIERAGAASVSVVIPPEGLPKGWDCGDLVKEGGGPEAIRDFLDRHTETYQPARHRPVEKALEQPARPRGVDEQDIPLSL
jgi:putative DNA primase/helicase